MFCCDGFPFDPLCDDFDHAIEPEPTWSMTGSPSLAATPFQSAPKALRTESGSYVSVTSAKAAKSAKLMLGVYAASDGTSGPDPTLVAIESAGGHGIALELVPGTSKARCVVKGFDVVDGDDRHPLRKDDAHTRPSRHDIECCRGLLR